MSPKPAPTTRSVSGEELPDWGVSIEWRTDDDTLVVRYWRGDTLRRRGKTTTRVIESGNVEDGLAHVQIAARTLSARRLF